MTGFQAARSRYGAGYRAALDDIMDAIERGGLDGALDWIENNADSKDTRNLTARATAARAAAAKDGDDAYTAGFKNGRVAERAETEASLDDLNKAGFRLVRTGENT